MNYSKKAITKRRSSLISSTAMMGKRVRVTIVRVLFYSMIALIVMGLCLGVGAFQGVIDNAPDVDSIDISPLGYASFLYDQEGNQLRKLTAPSSNRLPVKLDQVPLDLQHAVVAIEDERFYEHNGIDARGIVRAFVKGAASGFNFSEGASTITQQLLKNNVFTSWTSESSLVEKFTRKFQEQYLALEVEKKYSKDDILENYLNTINLGAGAYGVQAAAQTYFNKEVSELNLSECATLAGITQNPTKYNPILNPEENYKRRTEVLDHMLAQGYIDDTQYQDALSDDVYSRIDEVQALKEATADPVYSYFEDELIDNVIKDLMKIKGFTYSEASDMVYSGGLKIYITQDEQIQKILDEEYADESNYPDHVDYYLDYALTVTTPEGETKNYSREMLQAYFQKTDPTFDLFFDTEDEGRAYAEQYKAAILSEGNTFEAERIAFAPQPQSCMTVIDQHTGYVKAIIGGRGEKTASLTLNRASDSTRQPGSTFKILSTYAPALNEMGMTLATSFEDEPYKYESGASVNNFSMTFGGTTTIRKAIIESINVVAVKCLEIVTPDLGLSYLDKFGFTTLAHGTEADTDSEGNVFSDAYLPLALGGITNGVTNVELCAAYAAIANNGKYIEPIYYTKIEDRDGNIYIEKNSAGKSVITEDTAYLLTSAMEDVVTQGTGKLAALKDMPVAGKTGTTEDFNDIWFVGYTPYYTCAVWGGYDNNTKIDENDRNWHKELWAKVMERIHAGLPAKEFTRPSDIVEANVCSVTGYLPSGACNVTTEYFAPGTVPTEYCSGVHNTTVTISADGEALNEDNSATGTGTGAGAGAGTGTATDSGLIEYNVDTYGYDDTGYDAAYDANYDTGYDAGYDAADDANYDTGAADYTGDTGGDAAVDTTVDTGGDAGADAGTDAGV